MYVLNVGGTILGFFVTILITRRISVEDYGVWTMISNYVGYLILPSIAYSPWLVRNISRGQNTSRSGVYISLAIGIVLTPLYLLLMFVFSQGFSQPLVPLLLSTGILPLEYLNTCFNNIASGYAPQKAGYGSFVMKLGQAVSVYLFLAFLAMGLTGAVLAIIVGKFLMVMVNLYANWGILKESKFELSTVISWFRSSWVNLLAVVYTLIFSLDVIVVRVFYGSAIPVAFYGLSMSILSLSVFSNVVSSSLYPRIICKRNLEDLPEAIWLLLLLSVPIFLIVIIYATPICAIFGSGYLLMAWPLRAFSVATIFQLLSGLASVAYTGLEACDANELSSRKLIRSALLKSNVVMVIFSSLYLFSLFFVSLIGFPLVQFATLWGSILAITYFLQFVAQVFLIRRDFKATFPIKELIRRYVIFSIPVLPMVIPYFLIKIDIVPGFYQMVENSILPVILSVLLYGVFLYLIDAKFRKILKDTLLHISSIFNKAPTNHNTIIDQ
jgi:hypothetical protein